MNLLKRIFTRQLRVYAVTMEVRYRNKRVHTFVITVECKYKFEAKVRAMNELKLSAGELKKVARMKPLTNKP